MISSIGVAGAAAATALTGRSASFLAQPAAKAIAATALSERRMVRFIQSSFAPAGPKKEPLQEGGQPFSRGRVAPIGQAVFHLETARNSCRSRAPRRSRPGV